MKRVVITGHGLISSKGHSPETFHEALCAGTRQPRPSEVFTNAWLQAHPVMEIRDFSPEAHLGDKNFRPLDRAGLLSIIAASKALDHARWTSEERTHYEAGLSLGTVFCGLNTISEFDRHALVKGPKYAKPMDFANTVINAAAGQTALWFDLQGSNATIAAGPSSGLQSIVNAASLIAAGREAAILAGGMEALCFESLYSFSKTGMLARTGNHGIPFSSNSSGFILGEGAGFLMLESSETANTKGSNMIAEIRGSADGFDPNLGQDPASAVSTMVRVMTQACKQAQMDPRDIDCICASANGSKLDALEARAIMETFQSGPPPVAAPKAVLGECLGASGAFGVIAMLESMKRGRIPEISGLDPNHSPFPKTSFRATSYKTCLIHATGYDGRSCALIISRK